MRLLSLRQVRSQQIHFLDSSDFPFYDSPSVIFNSAFELRSEMLDLNVWQVLKTEQPLATYYKISPRPTRRSRWQFDELWSPWQSGWRIPDYHSLTLAKYHLHLCCFLVVIHQRKLSIFVSYEYFLHLKRKYEASHTSKDVETCETCYSSRNCISAKTGVHFLAQGARRTDGQRAESIPGICGQRRGPCEEIDGRRHST